MTLKATSIRLDEETLAGIAQIAEAQDRPRAWLMAQAIKHYVAQETWAMDQISKGIKAADEGRLIDHADLKAKWESKRANPMD